MVLYLANLCVAVDHEGNLATRIEVLRHGDRQRVVTSKVVVDHLAQDALAVAERCAAEAEPDLWVLQIRHGRKEVPAIAPAVILTDSMQHEVGPDRDVKRRALEQKRRGARQQDGWTSLAS